MVPSAVLNGDKCSQGFAEMTQFHLNQLSETIPLRVYSETKNFTFMLHLAFVLIHLECLQSTKDLTLVSSL